MSACDWSQTSCSPADPLLRGLGEDRQKAAQRRGAEGIKEHAKGTNEQGVSTKRKRGREF